MTVLLATLAPDRQLIDMIPTAINGWQRVIEKDAGYTPKTLYQYIDGGAELFISYGYIQSRHATYQKKDFPDIILEIYDMGEGKNAYGLYTHDLEKIDTTFGQGSYYSSGYLVFWKGCYYVTILADRETPDAQKAIFALAEIIDRKIKTKAKKPEITTLLPAEGLIPESIRYFFHYIWQNAHYFISNDNIFHIDKATEAVLARYDHLIVLCISYPQVQDAASAYHNFTLTYGKEPITSTIFQIDDGTWSSCRQIGNLIAAVFNGKTEEEIDVLNNRLLEKIKNR